MRYPLLCPKRTGKRDNKKRHVGMGGVEEYAVAKLPIAVQDDVKSNPSGSNTPDGPVHFVLGSSYGANREQSQPPQNRSPTDASVALTSQIPEIRIARCTGWVPRRRRCHKGTYAK